MRSSTPLFFVVAVLAFSCTSEPSKWTPRPVLENVPDRVVDLRISWRMGDEFRWTVEERYSNVSGRLHGDASRLVLLEARIRVVELAGDCRVTDGTLNSRRAVEGCRVQTRKLPVSHRKK